MATFSSPEQLLLARLDNNPLALIEWDEKFRVTRWSRRAEQMFGWKADEVLGLSPQQWNFIYHPDLKRIEDALKGFTSGELLNLTEHNRNLTKDGRVIDCAWYSTAVVDEGGKVVSILSLVQDETEAKRTERELQKQTERLKEALDAARMGIWDYDFETQRVTWLGHMESIYGVEPGQFSGSAEASLSSIHPADLKTTTELMQKAVKEHGEYDQEFRVFKRGQIAWVHSRGRPVYDASGKPIRITGTSVDITCRKASEDSLKKEKQSAETANSLKSAFLANMSHEIRTPLGVILGFSELLSDPELLPNERSEYMDVISRNGQHLSRLIDDILDLSKVEAGKLEIQTCVAELKPIIEEVVSSLQSKAFDRDVRLTVEYVGEIPEKIVTDPVRFKQIILNLTNNALKFTERGHVTLQVAAERFWKSTERQILRIRVKDTGIGISPDGQRQLFEPFVQADLGTTRRFGGTGLGLSLSRRIARSLGGDISIVRSVPGEGSVFEFLVPAGDITEPRHQEVKNIAASEDMRKAAPANPANFSSAPSQTKLDGQKPSGELARHEKLAGPARAQKTDQLVERTQPKPLDGIRVLVVDDARDNQVLMERVLSKRGASLETASNGEEALEKALHGAFDIVLMDIQMPKIDGYEATRRLRSRGFTVPIIALTAHAMKEERQKSLAAGCDEHLSKPVKPDELTSTILKLVQPSAISSLQRPRTEAGPVLHHH